MLNWATATFSSTIFFVLGQIALKLASFHPLIIGYWFSIAVGILGVIGLLMTLITSNEKIKHKDVWYALLGGVFFFFGNLLWIYAIQKAPNVSYVYTLTTGIVTVAMLFIGFYFFHQSMKWINFIGILFVVFGVYLITRKV